MSHKENGKLQTAEKVLGKVKQDLCSHESKINIQYRGTDQDYDGVSEIKCQLCGRRWGRWSGKVLKENELEKRFGGE